MKSVNKKILMVCGVDPEKSIFIKSEIQSLENRGHEIKLITRLPSKKPSKWVIYNGFFHKPNTPFKTLIWYLIFKFKGVFNEPYRQYINDEAQWKFFGKYIGTNKAIHWHNILRIAQQWKPDLIHVHFAWHLEYVIPLADILNIPIVFTAHGSDILVDQGWERKISNPRIKEILCVSKSIMNRITESCPSVINKTSILNNAINPIFLEDTTPPAKRLSIVCIAGFVPIKNHQWLLSALKLLSSKQISYNCTFIGEGKTEESIKKQATKLELHTQFIGWQTEDKIKEAIDNSSVLVLPSVSEGFGMVLIEALARKRVPVVTDLPGTREALNNGKHGFLVPLNDIAALENAILNAHKECLNQGDNILHGRHYVETKFSDVAHASSLELIYSK
ncbi:glycosyltransferase family 4 protein [Neptunomonas antarctica]|uniref:Glycosyltransferase involved in cell wall bisynthesis n=1 Tax=Neptunomonas antarctica TaxID=619304 RepID=A0A1N7JEF0_9GAMM|nr:glycosyltransferase family 4 protein [Neptunomonas antarctica]SIS47743.1 Glycosyltransferase involved in cell wall bisynthesis [Neptunomonas antarctica]